MRKETSIVRIKRAFPKQRRPRIETVISVDARGVGGAGTRVLARSRDAS